MGPFARIISTAAIACLALGSVSAVSLVSTAGFAEARSDNKGGGSRGKSGTKSFDKSNNGKGKKGRAPGYCARPIDDLDGLVLYDIATTAVQGAKDAMVRAAALLSDNEMPEGSASSEDVLALIAQIESQPNSPQNRAALKILNRQLDFLLAREDLASKMNAQAQARVFAAKGTAMSNEAIAALKASC